MPALLVASPIANGRSMVSRIGWLCVVLWAACSAQDRTSEQRADLHADFDRILRETVHGELVDYLAIRKLHRDRLLGYLDRLAATDPAGLPRDARLAFYINLYNATMIRAVVERFRVGYGPSADGFAVFKERLARVGDAMLSLDEIENRIIRPDFAEPRIHAALVCAARSCPPLLPRAYRADDLATVLEANMRRFVNDASRNKIDAAGRRLQLSPIFQWYADDFGGRDALAAWVNRYTDIDVAGFEVSFLEYSWELNIAPPREGRWVALRDGSVLEVVEEAGGRLRLQLPGRDGTAWYDAAQTVPSWK
jgi:hypothetical protein